MIQLNLGAGQTVIEGFTPIDRALGSEVYPLDYEDGTVDVIRASHVLEHFSHTEVFTVLSHWFAKLKPGGVIQIAVPDFEWIAREYLKGTPINSQGYVMGGHIDANDMHGCLFDKELLAEAMGTVGLERIGPWKSEIADCAALPVSLNLQGFKPINVEAVGKVSAVLSCPRYGPLGHTDCALNVFPSLGIEYRICKGAYWHETLSEAMELQLTRGYDYILTCDYDTYFTRQDVVELCRLARTFPEADAIAPNQAMRGADAALFGMQGMIDSEGKPRTKIYAVEFKRMLTKVKTAHFGLTLFKADSLRKFKRPWMIGKPGPDGRWAEGRVDPDIEFWHNWDAQGFGLYLANRVVVAHSDEVLTWPGKDGKTVYQTMKDYRTNGIPAEVQR